MKKIVIIYFFIFIVSCSGNNYREKVIKNTQNIILELKSGNTMVLKDLPNLSKEELDTLIKTFKDMDINRIVVNPIDEKGYVAVIVNINCKDVNSDLYFQYEGRDDRWVLRDKITITERVMYVPVIYKSKS